MINGVMLFLWIFGIFWFGTILPVTVTLSYFGNGGYLTEFYHTEGTGRYWRAWIPLYAHMELGRAAGLPGTGKAVSICHVLMLVINSIPGFYSSLQAVLLFTLAVVALVLRERIAGRLYGEVYPKGVAGHQILDFVTLGLTRGIRLLKCAGVMKKARNNAQK